MERASHPLTPLAPIHAMNKTKFEEKTSKGIEKHKSIHVAETIWEKYQDVIFCAGTFWQWEGRVYKPIDDIDWMILTAKRFPAFDESPPRIQNEVRDVYKRFSKVPPENFNSLDGLCLENVYLNLSDLKAQKHDKKRINTILIPYSYEPHAQCSLWAEKISQILNNDQNKIKCVQEFFGYCLTRQTEYHKALFLIGEGATGKSTVLDVLAALVGKHNVCNLSPRYYKDSMRISAIQNKLVLMSHEIPKGIMDYESEFRDIVTSGTLNVNVKYLKPFEFTPFCKIVWAMNEIPYINDHTSAFYRRILPIEFSNQISEEKQERNLIHELKKELPGILNWALVGLKRLRERGSFYRDAYMNAHIEEIRLQNNPVVAWAKENIKIKVGEEILKSEAYQKYDVWCGLNGYKKLGMVKFCSEIYSIFATCTKKDARQTVYPRKSIWPNLSWNKQEEEAKENIEWND